MEFFKSVDSESILRIEEYSGAAITVRKNGECGQILSVIVPEENRSGTEDLFCTGGGGSTVYAFYRLFRQSLWLCGRSCLSAFFLFLSGMIEDAAEDYTLAAEGREDPGISIQSLTGKKQESTFDFVTRVANSAEGK